MKRAKYLTAAVAALITFVVCNGNKNQEGNSAWKEQISAETKTANGSKQNTLIVYFSHTGENYTVGRIKVGNTKIIADYIQELTGAPEFEVIAKDKNYDMPYDELVDVAQKEQETKEKPAYKGDIDTEKYDTVYIGSPIWWGTFPQVMFTFLDHHDLNGKVIVPFTTHEGSGLGSIPEDLQKQYPQATIKEGLAIYGHNVKSAKPDVEKWLKKL